MSVSLIVLECTPILHRALGPLLAEVPGIIVTAMVASVSAAERLPSSMDASVILADVDSIDMNGTQGVGRLATRFPWAQIVMLGPDAEPGLIIALLRAGADGYVTRSTPPEALVRAIRAAGRGEAAVPRGLTHLLVEAIRFTGPMSDSPGLLGRLSPREREVFLEIAHGYSNMEIATRFGVSESTVKTHVSSILRKTGSRSRFVLQTAGQT